MEIHIIDSGTYKKALLLSYFTVGYNFLEGVVSILAGLLAGSIALIGFGLDSFVESLSGGVMVWRLSKHGEISLEEEEKIEAKAIRLIAYTFFILGAYVLYESIKKLYFREIPDPSLFGYNYRYFFSDSNAYFVLYEISNWESNRNRKPVSGIKANTSLCLFVLIFAGRFGT